MVSKAFHLARSLARMFLKAYGIDFKQCLRGLRNTPRYVRDYRSYRRRLAESPEARKHFPLQRRRVYPALSDFEDAAGALGVYFHQDLWAARNVFAQQPDSHVDIGSRIDGFVGHLLVFMDVSIVDVRAMPSSVDGLSFVQADATRMEQFETDSIDSLSSLHAAEHFGLGRYGDPVDPDACFVYMRALQRVLAVGGRLLFSVPIGPEGVHFNAHRVFAPQTVIDTFDRLSLVSFSAVQDRDRLIEGADPERYLAERYKVGLFEFTKVLPIGAAT